MRTIWKRLKELYKDDGKDNIDGFYIMPCDECNHFGNCKYEKQCEEDVKLGKGLRHFEEKK